MNDIGMSTQSEISFIVKNVETNIIGRVANKILEDRQDSLETLLEFIYRSGGGNHIEIGTLFGGSAISVALAKRKFKHDGIVFCIDPLDGYYSQFVLREDKIDTQSHTPVTPETLFRNIEIFNAGSRICVLRAYSENVYLQDITFSTAYIDGNHKGDAPFEDWLLVKDITTRYVMFDNYDKYHPDVKNACLKAALDKEWKPLGVFGVTYILERMDNEDSSDCQDEE